MPKLDKAFGFHDEIDKGKEKLILNWMPNTGMGQ